MAAAARAVPDRVERLLRPPSHARSAAFTAALTLALALLAAAPPALTLLASEITATGAPAQPKQAAPPQITARRVASPAQASR